MRVLQINTSVNYGSTGRIAEGIGNSIIENGGKSYIAYGRINGTSKSTLIKIGSYKDIYGHGLKTLLYDKHGLGSKKATKKLLKDIDNIKPDAIGLHNIHGYYINYQILFKYIKEKKIPILWTLHDTWAFTGHCTFFDSVNCHKWQTHCKKCPLSTNYPRSFSDRSFKNFEDKRSAFTGVNHMKIITPSQWLAKHIKHSYLKKYPVSLIHNGIDTDVFRPLEHIESTQKKIILGIANVWDKRKGLHDFIELSNLLPEDYEIVLIGLSKKQIKTLPKKIKGISRTKNIHELVKWYNKATVFVNPTYVDNFPTTNIEALACGTPIITYNTGGSPEALDNDTGIIVKKGNILELSIAIQKIKKNTNLINKCRKRAENYFDSKQRFKDYLNLYTNF